MVKAKYILLPLVVVLMFVAYWYYFGSSRTPAGQPPLTSLTQDDFNQFTRVFNDKADLTRLVLLVSPT